VRLVSVLCCGLALASCATPDLVTLRSAEASPAALARDADALLALERDEALALLEEEARRAERGPSPGSAAPSIDVPERIGWLCRLVFVDAEGRPVRAPRRGAVSLPDLSMPAESWPHFPLAVEDGCIFVLAEGLVLAGLAEPLDQYFAELRRSARLSEAHYAQPGREACERAFAQLLASPRWRAIRWTYSSPNHSYACDEPSIERAVRGRF
jgi:hypothetical protein